MFCKKKNYYWCEIEYLLNCRLTTKTFSKVIIKVKNSFNKVTTEKLLSTWTQYLKLQINPVQECENGEILKDRLTDSLYKDLAKGRLRSYVDKLAYSMQF